MQSTGQTSIHMEHNVQDQVSIAYVSLNFIMAFSGQISLQLSQDIHRLLISSSGFIGFIIAFKEVKFVISKYYRV